MQWKDWKNTRSLQLSSKNQIDFKSDRFSIRFFYTNFKKIKKAFNIEVLRVKLKHNTKRRFIYEQRKFAG
jgi:hypothetical protein